MKYIAFTPALAAIVLIFTSFTSSFANPIAVNSLSSLSVRELLNELEARSFDLDDFDLERRGSVMSKISHKDPERKAKYNTGNPKPETPKGEVRPHYAGKKDDYFGDWKGVQKGVKNPAAGKGKYKRDELETRTFDLDEFELERRGSALSKISHKDPERKAKYDTGNPKPETPKGQFRPSYAGKNDDYFGDWQGVQKGVKNPAAGKGKYKRQFDDEYELFF